MTRGFVFGKFLPFHKGHEAMIRFALGHCDALTVLVCAETNEPEDARIRCAWIESTFDNEPRVTVRAYTYDKRLLSDSSESSRSASKDWADVFLRELPGHTLLVTSEPYGAYVAEYMNIRHLPFDPERALVPVSSSQLREAPLSHWKYLPESVRPYYARKVVLLGTESTGKSTLAARLAVQFGATLVTEAARDLITDSTDFGFDELYTVAGEHARRIELAARKGSGLLIIDTDVHITQSYARRYFGRELELSEAVRTANRAHLYLYLDNDVPHIQDGTRLGESERNALDLSHRTVAAEAGLQLVEIKGSWEERFQLAMQAVEKLIS